MANLQEPKNLVSIGITTKNRWQDLQLTLKRIADTRLEDLPILIYDDNSDQPCPFDPSTLGFRRHHVEKDNEAKGYIVRRNQLARLMDTKYYLSLDDDSYPVCDSVKAAIDFAESCTDLFCLSFPIYNPKLAKYQNSSLCKEPYQVRFFVGCGHLLHIERFLQLGGYREELVHQGEEMEIAARAFQQGWSCYHFPNFQIHHNSSLSSRNWHRMDYYGSRNLMLWNDWFVPTHLKVVKQYRTTIARMSHMVKVRRLSVLSGVIAGFKDISHYKRHRQPMTQNLYEKWKNLPYS